MVIHMSIRVSEAAIRRDWVSHVCTCPPLRMADHTLLLTLCDSGVLRKPAAVLYTAKQRKNETQLKPTGLFQFFYMTIRSLEHDQMHHNSA